MSNRGFNWVRLRRHLTIQTLAIFLIGAFFTLPMVLIFVYALNRQWYDGLSVAGALYIGLGLLSLVFNFAEFQHFKKVKNLFVIKKESNQPLTKIERRQMRILGVKYDEENPEEKKVVDKGKRYFRASLFLIYGLILLVISLPFLLA